MNENRILDETSNIDDSVLFKAPSENEIDDAINSILEMSEEELNAYLFDNNIIPDEEVNKVKNLLNGSLATFPSSSLMSKKRFNDLFVGIMNVIIDVYVKGGVDSGASGDAMDKDKDKDNGININSLSAECEVKNPGFFDSIKIKIRSCFLIHRYELALASIISLTCSCLLFYYSNSYLASDNNVLVLKHDSTILSSPMMPLAIKELENSDKNGPTAKLVSSDQGDAVTVDREIALRPKVELVGYANDEMSEINSNSLPLIVMSKPELSTTQSTQEFILASENKESKENNGVSSVKYYLSNGKKLSDGDQVYNGEIAIDKTLFYYIASYSSFASFDNDLISEMKKMKYKAGDSFKIVLDKKNIKTVEVANENGVYYSVSNNNEKNGYLFSKKDMAKDKSIIIDGVIDVSFQQSLIESNVLDKNIIDQVVSLAPKSTNVDFRKLNKGDRFNMTLVVNSYNGKQVGVKEITSFEIKKKKSEVVEYFRSGKFTLI